MEKARGILGAMLCCFRVGFCSAGKRCQCPVNDAGAAADFLRACAVGQASGVCRDSYV
jgi:hypothetical protein